jgi:hypothetical protein
LALLDARREVGCVGPRSDGFGEFVAHRHPEMTLSGLDTEFVVPSRWLCVNV